MGSPQALVKLLPLGTIPRRLLEDLTRAALAGSMLARQLVPLTQGYDGPNAGPMRIATCDSLTGCAFLLGPWQALAASLGQLVCGEVAACDHRRLALYGDVESVLFPATVQASASALEVSRQLELVFRSKGWRVRHVVRPNESGLQSSRCIVEESFE